jgi:hypothetical protein
MRFYMVAFFVSVASFFASNPANANFNVINGPTHATVFSDRYSSISTFRILYTGYLHSCEDGLPYSSVSAHLIFHGQNGTKVFVRPMFKACGREPWVSDNASYLETTRYQNSLDSELWDYVELATLENIRFEVAFVAGDRWDSNYGRNFLIVDPKR